MCPNTEIEIMVVYIVWVMNKWIRRFSTSLRTHSIHHTHTHTHTHTDWQRSVPFICFQVKWRDGCWQRAVKWMLIPRIIYLAHLQTMYIN